jgi:ferric-dicitrate binding protein FerR (iron transport regulator)
VGEVDRLGLLAQQCDFAARVIVALLEGLESCSCVSFETKLRCELGPVELEGGTALLVDALVSLRRRFQGHSRSLRLDSGTIAPRELRKEENKGFDLLRQPL